MGAKPLLLPLPRRQRPDPRAGSVSGYSHIPGGAQPHGSFWDRGAGLAAHPRCGVWAGVAHLSAVVLGGSPWPQPLGERRVALGLFMAPKGLQLMRVGEGRVRHRGQAGPDAGTVVSRRAWLEGCRRHAEPGSGARRPAAPSLPHPTRPDPTWANHISQEHPDPMGLGTTGTPPALGHPAGDAPKPLRNVWGAMGAAHLPAPIPCVHGEMQIR